MERTQGSDRWPQPSCPSICSDLGAPQQRPWIVLSKEEQNCRVLPKFQSQNRKYTKMGVVLCHQVLGWYIRQPQITGALCDAKEGWLDPHSGSRRENHQPRHWDEQDVVAGGQSWGHHASLAVET